MGFRVKENTFRGGNGSSSRSSDGTRKTKRTFIVEYDANTPPASMAVVETADDGTLAIPELYEGLPGDTSRIVTDVDVKPRGDTGLVFDVEVTYELPDLTGFGESPLTVPVDYDWDFGASSQTYFEDCDEDPKVTVTSAGEPFENLLERETGEIVVTIVDNIVPSAWNPALAAVYMSDPATAVNDAAITVDGFAVDIGQARFAGVKCSGVKTSNGIDYRTRTIVLKLRKTWDQDIEDRGFHERYEEEEEVDGDTVVFTGLREIVKGEPPVKVDKTWPLDGEGGKMPNPDDPAAVLTFVPYPKRDFVTWGIS